MAITYHAGRRIQGGGTDVTTSTSGTTANATNNGSGCTQVTGIIGNALDFNSGNYQIPKASINFGSEWSVNYWVNVETTSGTSNNNYHLVARGSTMDSNFRSYLSYDDPNGAPALMINCYDSTGTRVSYDTSNNHMWLNLNAHAGSWAMVTFTWNNSDKKLRAYLNGSLASTSKAWTHSSAGNMGTPTHDWGLGNNESDTASTYSAKAKFDEMSFWKCTLSDADITELYNDGSGIEATALSNTTSMSKLNTYYNFEQGTNATLTNQAPTTVTIQDAKPTNVQVGSRYEETNTRKMYYRMDSDYVTDKWFELGTLPYAGGRGVFAGGYNGSYLNTLDYVTIATLGNATDFGDLSFGRFSFGSCANNTRGLFMGGAKSGGNSDSIDYITIATLSDSTDFGDIAQDGTKTSGTTSISNNTRGFVAGGESGYTDRIAYVTIDTLGNTTDFGNLTAARKNLGSTNNDTRAVFIGGEGSQGTMDYITMANTPLSNATTFGTLTSGSYQMANGLISNGTRGVFGIGGGTSSGGYNNIIEYINIATTGSSIDFGNLTEGRAGQGQSSSATRGLLAGGKYQGGSTSVRATIDYITIDTAANAGDFGDLTQARSSLSGLSDTGALRE